MAIYTTKEAYSLKPSFNPQTEYIDVSTNLLHCKKCGHPLQRKIHLGAEVLTVRCACSCQITAYEEQEQARAHHQFLNAVEQNRFVALPSPAQHTHTFQTSANINASQLSIAAAFVEHWDEHLQAGNGLLLWGGCGAGKTYLAECIANALVDRGIKVCMRSSPEVLTRLTDFKAGSSRDYLESLDRFPLLILDDFGAEWGTDFAKAQLFNLIDRRYRSRRPLIITTNLHLTQLQHPANPDQERIFTRILEMCMPLLISGSYPRDTFIATTAEQAKKLRNTWG